MASIITRGKNGRLKIAVALSLGDTRFVGLGKISMKQAEASPSHRLLSPCPAKMRIH